MNEIREDLPFKITPSVIIDANGVKTPSNPEIFLLGAIYSSLREISAKLDAPILNVTNHPPSNSFPATKKTSEP